MRRGTQLFSRSLSAAIMARAPSRDRRTTSRAPVGLAPDPGTTPEAVIQVYGARCSGWLGYFGIHTWIAVKPAGARALKSTCSASRSASICSLRRSGSRSSAALARLPRAAPVSRRASLQAPRK